MLARMWKYWNPCVLLVGMQNGAAPMENGMWFLKKLKTEPPYDSAIPLPDTYPKELKAGSGTDICTFMFLAALFTKAKRWKHPKCPLMDKWISKMCYINTMEYFLALKRKEILSYATTWMNLEDIMLSEIS